ncbi:MAG: hypothetical protein KC481_19455 [Acidimicrobiaceae bacterium]|nr:DNA-binding protein [Acidimicrobiaceae bacterium]MCO4835837.1 hypothetical protein [Acidimicrobiaceae bacterium]HAY68621.1 DNA-binding protein [Acidimicrobiaceae bacterium]
MSDQIVAFDRAFEAREAIAKIIGAVRSGEADLSAAFAAADADPLVGRCFAVKVFEAVPEIGKVRARRTMADLGIPEDIWLHQVPADKRAAIIAAFAGPGPL